MTVNRKHLTLFTVAMFFLGLAAGAVAKTAYQAPDLTEFTPLHLVLLFSSGLSMGAIITRIRYERKIERIVAGDENRQP